MGIGNRGDQVGGTWTRSSDTDTETTARRGITLSSVTGTLLGVALLAVLKSGLATLPVVIRLNAAEEISGLLTGALLLVALTGSVLPKILSSLRGRRQAG